MAFKWLIAFCTLMSVFHPSYQSTVSLASTASTPVQNANPYTSGAGSENGNGNSYPAEEHIEYPPYDGWYNNFAHPDWGAADTKMLRLLPPAYGDGVYAPAGADRPNPHEIARAVFDGKTGEPSYKGRTALLVFFGQQLVEEILDAQRAGCPPEYFNIPIPTGHPLFDPESHGGRELPFLRSRYDMRTGNSPHAPREQLNEVTPFFDGNLMYGPNKAWTDAIRLFKDGLLAATNDSTDPGAVDRDRYFPAINDIRLPFANPPPPRDHVLKPIRRFFKIGNPRGNENPFLLTWGIVWFRYHNVKARQLKDGHPDWDDEKLFNEARKWTIAIHQKIVYYDWLPAWLGTGLEPYQGYDQNVHPQIAHVFQSAAMRFGHTMVPPGVLRRTASCVFRNTTKATMFEGRRGLRTCNSYWNPQESIRESDIDEFLMGMASQVAEREDHIVTPDLHGHVFGPLDFSRRDLMAVNIQRGRDHGLPDYNTARRYFDLDPIKRWEDINENTASLSSLDEAIQKTKDVYGGQLDNVDIWAGGMLETTPDGPGPLFQRIIKNQFRRIRSADRFWFENYKQNRLFTKQEVDEIYSTTVKQVILAVTNIPENAIQDNPFFLDGAPCVPDFAQLSATNGEMEDCTRVKSFDYFSGSETAYVVTVFFILGSTIPMILLLLLLAHLHKKSTQKERAKLHQTRKRSQKISDRTTMMLAVEWMGHKQGSRAVVMTLEIQRQRIGITEDRRVVRNIDLSKSDRKHSVAFMLSADVEMKLLLVRVPKEYDLVLILENGQERQQVLDKLMKFFRDIGMPISAPVSQSEKVIKQQAITKDKRQKILDRFFSAIFAQALEYDEGYARQSLDSASGSLNYVSCELTKSEFADSLGLQPDSMFVTNMFKMVDKSNNGYISFREFLDFFVIFSRGKAEDKAKLLFNMYDLNKSQTLSKDEFKTMLRSMVELGNEKIEEDKIDDVVSHLFQQAGLENKREISFDEFQQVLRDYRDVLNVMSLDMQFGDTKVQPGKRENAAARARRTLLLDPHPGRADGVDPKNRYSTFAPLNNVTPLEKKQPKGMQLYYQWVTSFVETYRRQIFWAVLYTLLLFGVFIERGYFFAIEREQAGLRRICGYGVTITRGAASAMMFTYASLLVTMCRNLITFLRDTFLHMYIPFDDAVSMHKYIAFLAAVFTLVHIVGHCFNIYHISSQTANDLACLFRNYFHATDELPKFQRWAWGTLTGFTGMLLTLQFFLIYIFSIQYARRHTFRAFWIIHLSYPIYFILMLLHGAGRMIQAAFTYYFVLGPFILFAIDQLISVSRRKIEIPVVNAKLLPSDVTYLEMKKPPGFNYKSGQWIRIACLKRGGNEYHPFTLTSAPHEEHLQLYIRAVGPWTLAIRRLYDDRLLTDHKYPTVYVDGPYGEGHQDWHRYDVSILVGGGIGVTPFGSILKDIVEKSRSNVKFQCRKVYFVWVTRTQRQFEWMTDILREVEEKDTKNLVETHVFITQYKEKFDIRTTMLYICERYFQKIADRSLFTGLRSATHFGRPDFQQFFHMVRAAHPDVNVFGVFTCGPPPLTSGVDKACAHDNKYIDDVILIHHHENF